MVPAWRQAHAGHVSLDQLKVMSAIESCRTAALGGHVARCEDCAYTIHRLQLLPQPALPEVPGRRRQAVARRSRGRAAAGAVLSRRVHAAGSDRRHRLSQQGRHLRSAVQGLGRDDADDRRRSEASRRQDRHHLRAAYLGLGHDPSPACPHDRAGRRHLARRPTLGVVPAGLLPAGARALAPVPTVVSGAPRRPPSGRPPELLRRRRSSRRSTIIRRYLAPRRARPNGSSMPSVRSAVHRPCWPICRAIPTASPSPTAA